MTCQYFGKCGSCKLYELSYEQQLEQKVQRVEGLLDPFYRGEFDVYPSPGEHFRARAEFRIFREEGRLYCAMHDFEKKLLPVTECPKVIEPVEGVIYPLLEAIEEEEILERKLYSVEFLSGLSGEVLVTLIYHKKLDSAWETAARKLQERFGIFIIGRSRKQKVILTREFITEKLEIKGREYLYRHYEASFTQPNAKVNEKMIEWAMAHVSKTGDLLESYCGAGNFTIPLSTLYDRVLATEISKRSIQAAKENCELNGVDNIAFVRLSSEEMTSALRKEREFTRLKGVDLDGYGFQTVLVDPPRAGLDEGTRELIAGVEQIVYISCNPETLSRDLEYLAKTHRVETAAVFDQFPYSEHVESGVVLRRI